MSFFVTSLRENPELAVFLTLALGFVIGRFRVGSFRPGNVVGTLLAGVLVGQLDIQVAPVVKTVFFDLFLFATGYKVGPQFFRGLKKNALSQVMLTIVLCVSSLVVTVAVAKVMGYDCGTAAGLMAGAFTESTVIGTAGNTISRLGLPEAETTRLLNNIPVAYAVSYLVGTGFVVWFLSSLAPRLLKVDLKEESRKLEEQLGAASAAEGAGRARRTASGTSAPTASGRTSPHRTAADLERSFAPARVFVQRVRRGTWVVDAEPATAIQAGDVVVLTARRHVLLTGSPAFAEEVEDRELLDFPVAVLDVVVTSRDLAERTLAELAEDARTRRGPSRSSCAAARRSRSRPAPW